MIPAEAAPRCHFSLSRQETWEALADECVSVFALMCAGLCRRKSSADREVVSECKSEGAPWATERLINPNSSSPNEVLITPTDSLKMRRQSPKLLMITYLMVWSGGESFHYTIKIPCVFMCMCVPAHLCLKQLSAQPTSHTEWGGHCVSEAHP